jgi:4-hydroxy-tetrahydrodipicolinate synthase
MSVNSSKVLHGSNVAIITPLLANGDVDFKSLRELVKWHIESGTDGLIVLGTTGEPATLTSDEEIQVLETVIEVNAGQLPIIVGNGTNCTATTIERTKKFEHYAIDGFLTVTPYYNRPCQRGMVAHFKAVAQATDKPIILYNVPTRTGVDLENEAVFELMKVDNIVGIKDATSDISRVKAMKEQDADFLLFSGDDLTSQHYLMEGGDGVISVTANVEPGLMKKMVSATLAGQDADAELFDEKLALLHRDLFIAKSPAPTKWALLEKGLIQSDMMRLPMMPMEPKYYDAVKQALEHAK